MRSSKKTLIMTMAMTMATTLLVGSIGSAGEDSGRPTRGEFRAAMKACMAENNLTRPERGQRPNESDRAKLDACLTSKGIMYRPNHDHKFGRRHGHGRGHKTADRRTGSTESNSPPAVEPTNERAAEQAPVTEVQSNSSAK